MSSATHETESEHSEHGAHDDGAVHAHVSPVLFMVAVFGALIFLTVVTVAVSYVDLGPANNLVAVGVATLKAALVATFFMHLRWDKPFHALVFVGSCCLPGALHRVDPQRHQHAWHRRSGQHGSYPRVHGSARAGRSSDSRCACGPCGWRPGPRGPSLISALPMG